jgi:hypothetical protein
MKGDEPDIEASVQTMRPQLPAKELETSNRFYVDLGFQSRVVGPGLLELSVGRHSFLLQDYYVKEWAENTVMYLLVSDLRAWWNRIKALDLPKRYGVPTPGAPETKAWGHRVVHLTDPAGVLWKIAEEATQPLDTSSLAGLRPR